MLESDLLDNESNGKSKEKRKRRVKSTSKRALKLKKLSLNLRRDLQKTIKPRQRLAMQNKINSQVGLEDPALEPKSQVPPTDGSA